MGQVANVNQEEEKKMHKEEVKDAKKSPSKEIKGYVPNEFSFDEKVPKPKWNFFDKIKKMFFKNKPDEE
jgi:hypothetical protein